MRKRTAADIRRDEYEAMIRRCLALVGLYQEMLQSHLASNAFDMELVRRMLSIRETVLLLLEAAMPVPVAADSIKIEEAA
jgi:hypothetical protein